MVPFENLMALIFHLYPCVNFEALDVIFPVSLDSLTNDTEDWLTKMMSVGIKCCYRMYDINVTLFEEYQYNLTVSTPAKSISKAITTATCLSIFTNYSRTLFSRF